MRPSTAAVSVSDIFNLPGCCLGEIRVVVDDGEHGCFGVMGEVMEKAVVIGLAGPSGGPSLQDRDTVEVGKFEGPWS